MTAPVDMKFLNSAHFNQFYLPPVKPLMTVLEESDLSETAQLIVYGVVMIFTGFIACLAEVLVFVANENSLKNRYTQLEKARAEIYNGRSDFSDDKKATEVYRLMAGRIVAVKVVEALPEVDANTKKHTFLDGIERDLKMLVGKLNQEI